MPSLLEQLITEDEARAKRDKPKSLLEQSIAEDEAKQREQLALAPAQQPDQPQQQQQPSVADVLTKGFEDAASTVSPVVSAVTMAPESAKHAAGTFIDFLDKYFGAGGRAVRGGLQATYEGKVPQDIVTEVVEGAKRTPGHAVYGSDWLKKAGVTNPLLAGSGGLLIDIATDPLMGPFGGEVGGLTKLGRAAKAMGVPMETATAMLSEAKALRAAGKLAEAAPLEAAASRALGKVGIKATTPTIEEAIQAAPSAETGWEATKRGATNFLFGNQRMSAAQAADVLAQAPASARTLAPSLESQAIQGQRAAFKMLGDTLATPQAVNETLIGAAANIPRVLGNVAEKVKPLKYAKDTITRLFVDSSGVPGVQGIERASSREKTAQILKWQNELARWADQAHGAGFAERDFPEFVALVEEPTYEIRQLGTLNREAEDLVKQMHANGLPVPGDLRKALAKDAAFHAKQLQHAEAVISSFATGGPATLAQQNALAAAMMEKAANLAALDVMREGPASYGLELAEDALNNWHPRVGANQHIWQAMKTALDDLNLRRDSVMAALKTGQATAVPASRPELGRLAMGYIKMMDDILTAEQVRGMPARELGGRLGYFPHVLDPALRKYADLADEFGLARWGVRQQAENAAMLGRTLSDLTVDEINQLHAQGKLASYAGLPLKDFTGSPVAMDPFIAAQTRIAATAKAHAGATYLDELRGFSDNLRLDPKWRAQLVPVSEQLRKSGLGGKVPSTTYDRIRGVELPPDAAQYVANQIALMTTPKEQNRAADIWNEVLAWWKSNATLGRPGYHTRNELGNFLQVYLAGVDRAEPWIAAAKMQHATPEALLQGRRFVPSLGRELTYDELMEEAARHANYGGGSVGREELGRYGVDVAGPPTLKPVLSSADMPDMGAAAEKFLPEGRNRARSAANIVTQVPILSSLVPGVANRSWFRRLSQNVGSAFENNARLAVFIDQLDKGATLEAAGATARKFLFDYGDLTDFQKQLRTFGFPFIAWQLKNVPLQMEALARSPSKLGREIMALREVERQMEPLSPEAQYDQQVKAHGQEPINIGERTYIDPRTKKPAVASAVAKLQSYMPIVDAGSPIDLLRGLSGTAEGQQPLVQRIMEAAQAGTGPRAVSAFNPILQGATTLFGGNWDPYREREIDPMERIAQQFPMLRAYVPHPEQRLMWWDLPVGAKRTLEQWEPQLAQLTTWNPGAVFGEVPYGRPEPSGALRTARFAGLLPPTIPVGTPQDLLAWKRAVDSAKREGKLLIRGALERGDPGEAERYRLQVAEMLRQMAAIRRRGGEPMPSEK